MASRLLIFDHFCQFITETSVSTTPRNWVLNNYGRAEFSIGYDPSTPQDQQVCREEYFQFGNLVQIIHVPAKDASGNDKGQLPNWTGILLPPRKWDLGVMHVTAYSAEAILMFRAMKYRDISGTPKTVLGQIIEIVNERTKNIVFQPGVMEDLPLTFPDVLRTNAYDHIGKLVQNSGMDWDVSGKVNGKGNLDLYVNLYNRRGQAIDTPLDNENTELGSPLLTEQGTPYNQIYGYSQAQTANSRFGPIEAINQGAYDDYGPLQLNQVLVGKKDPTSVGNSVQALADARGRPVKITRRVALDIRDTFSLLEVGNTFKVVDNNAGFNSNGKYGFQADARILSIDYNDLSNQAPLNLEIS